MDVETFRRLLPLQYVERYLDASVRPDGRALGRVRPTDVFLGYLSTTDGSAMVRVGNTTMLAGIKLEVFVPSSETPDEGRIAVDFQMPPICSPYVRPGRSVEDSCVITKQLSDALASSKLVNLQELSIATGKSAWLAHMDIYCLNADGSLIDAAFLACVAALGNLQVPAVSINVEGNVQRVSGNSDQTVGVDKSRSDGGGMDQGNFQDKITLRAKRRLYLGAVPAALTCMLHKEHLLADPTAEEEAVLQTSFTVVINTAGRLISVYKPGGLILATTSTFQDCIALARIRLKEVQQALTEATETTNAVDKHSQFCLNEPTV